MTLQEGDSLSVPEGASVRLVYFQVNRQETWRGPAAFRVTKTQGEAASGKPEVNVLPSAVPAKMARLPQLMQNVKLGGLGGVVIRGGRAPAPLSPEEQAQLTQARGNYAVLRAQSSADDITPELYLISTLQEFGQYQEMGPLLDEVSKHQPLAPEVEDLVRWLRARAGS